MTTLENLNERCDDKITGIDEESLTGRGRGRLVSHSRDGCDDRSAGYPLHVLSPEFSPSRRVISEYALGHYPWVLSLMFLQS